MPWCTSSGVSLHYAVSGDGPRSVVVTHELGGGLASWDLVVPRLEATCRVVRYDQRGAGLSEKVRAPFTTDDHVNDLEAVARAAELTPPYVVAGVAYGAAIALAFASRHPDLASAAILCAPAMGVDAERRRYLADRSALAAREGMRAVVDDTLARSYPEIVIRDRAVYEAYRGRFLANDPVSYGLANGALASANLETAIGAVRCRCLLLAGRHDGLRPPDRVRALADRLHAARVAVLDSGHLMSVQCPDPLADEMLAFLAELPS